MQLNLPSRRGTFIPQGTFEDAPGDGTRYAATLGVREKDRTAWGRGPSPDAVSASLIEA